MPNTGGGRKITERNSRRSYLPKQYRDPQVETRKTESEALEVKRAIATHRIARR